MLKRNQIIFDGGENRIADSENSISTDGKVDGLDISGE